MIIIFVYLSIFAWFMTFRKCYARNFIWCTVIFDRKRLRNRGSRSDILVPLWPFSVLFLSIFWFLTFHVESRNTFFVWENCFVCLLLMIQNVNRKVWMNGRKVSSVSDEHCASLHCLDITKNSLIISYLTPLSILFRKKIDVFQSLLGEKLPMDEVNSLK